ncbi:MFS transporter, DHA1 family, bicyclomycin/chloramphenicol resistance protein [Nakamurella panacisegetis]|uniref:MFS transporter, DHA1 family, bicyclomycin/chloramphenicol resistance protein n=1 Tax=Nakamurella panacisegetis TaxID=1090615 RepID=A0A1H0P4U5_9ACTN|nr:multidrug effflux MFS transporter [Nakamurella panacisegetis]SDO99993.1 MFS transporter, DHA1 family, bicyclomycin/chloramphenicol resistance protein [Nakamurella panacisegetis]
MITLGALSAFGPLCMDMYLPSLPELSVSLSSTASAAQLSLSACIVGLGAGQLVVGPFSDRLGRRRPLLIGLLLFVVTSALCAVTTSMALLIGLRLVQGAAGAAGIVLCRAIVADRFTGKAAASYFSTIAAINGLAPIMAPVFGAQVLRIGTWRTVFWVLTGIGVVLTVLAVWLVRETLPPERRSREGLSGTFRTFGRLLTDRVFLGYAIAGSTVCAAMFGYISASPFLLQDGFHLSPQTFSFCFAANAFGIVATSSLGGLLLRRTTSVVLMRWGVGQCVVGAAMLAAALLAGTTLPWLLVSLFVMVSSVGFALPHASVLAMDRHRTVAGAASALIGAFQYAFGAVTSRLVSFGDKTAGTALAFTALGAAALAVAGLLMARRGSPALEPARVAAST